MLEMLRKSFGGTSREVRQDRQFEQLKAAARTATPEDFWETEPIRDLRGGGTHNAAIGVIEGVLRGQGGLRTVNVRNQGAITNLPDDALVEMSCRFEDGGFTRLQNLAVPEAVAPLTRCIIGHQKLVVKAALEKDRKVLLQAFLADPNMRSLDRAEPMVDELLRANRDYMPGWR